MSTEHKSPYAYYKEYGKENDASVESDYNKIKGDTSTLLSDYKTALDQSYETAEKKLNEQAAAQTAALPQQYRSAFDKNELQQRINERQLQERMQRMGLTNSGLNRSQQTALQLQRSNADQAVGQQKNAAAAQIQQQKQAALDAACFFILSVPIPQERGDQKLYCGFFTSSLTVISTVAVSSSPGRSRRATIRYFVLSSSWTFV